MIADNELKKWEYKLVNLMTSRDATTEENVRVLQLAALLNKDGQDNWELISQIQQGADILPVGFVVLKRPYQAPKVAPKRSIFSPGPKVTAAAKAAAPAVAVAVAPAAAKPLVAAALSPTAGKTDKATA